VTVLVVTFDTEPITGMREDHFSVSLPPDLLVPGQYYLIGGPAAR